MTETIQAIYENGVLKPERPLALKEHEKVTVTIQPAESLAKQSAGMVPAPRDAALFDRLLAELEEGGPFP